MKLLAIFSLCFVLMFFDCASKSNKSVNNEAKQGQVEKNMSEFLSYENVEDGVEYKFKAEMKKAGNYNGIEYKNDFLELEYELNNTTDRDYVVFNKGHFGSNSYKVYIEANSDGIVEISQKAFEEPKGKKCPDRFVAISPLSSALNSKDKMTEKIQLELPLQARTPYDDCEPKDELPKEIKEAKFCIGIMQTKPNKNEVQADGRVIVSNLSKEQKLLCSDSVTLK